MLKINEEFKRLIPALTQEEYKQLEDNILKEGIREKIITWNDTIIDGHNRYEIAQKWGLDYQTEPMHFKDTYDVIDWMLKNQLGRRNVTKEQKKYLIGKQYENDKQRQGTRNDLTLGQNVPKLSTAEKIAKEVGISDKQVKRDAEFAKGVDKLDNELRQTVLEGKAKVNIKDVEEIAKAEPTFIATSEKEILEKAKEIRDKKKEEKQKQRVEIIQKQIEEIETGKLPELQGLFDVISVDPPWPYEGDSKKITSFDAHGRRVANPYPEMSIEEIKNIEMPLMDNAILFLWTTHKFLPYAFDILNYWNLEYKATLVWNKEKIGMGAWFRMQCEFCLVGIKGKPYFENTKYRDIFSEPRREHSRKPDSFFKMVEEITLGRRLEYFSREKREGWEVFGNDIEKF